MKVSALIEKLRELPQDAEVRSVYDYYYTEPVDTVLLENGVVVLSPEDMADNGHDLGYGNQPPA